MVTLDIFHIEYCILHLNGTTSSFSFKRRHIVLGSDPGLSLFLSSFYENKRCHLLMVYSVRIPFSLVFELNLPGIENISRKLIC